MASLSGNGDRQAEQVAFRDPRRFSATSTSRKNSAPYPQSVELLSIKNATTQESAASGLVGMRPVGVPPRVSQFRFLPQRSADGQVTRVNDPVIFSLV